MLPEINWTQIDGWYSRVYSNGIVFSGHKVVCKNNKVLLDQEGKPIAGIGPQYYDQRTNQIFFKGFDDRPYLLIEGKNPEPAAESSSEGYAAGGGAWMRRVAGTVWVSMSREGESAWIIEYNGENHNHTLFASSWLNPVVSSKPVNWCRREGDALVWSMNGRIYGARAHGMTSPQPLQLAVVPELLGIPVPTPEGMWLLTMTNDDLRLAPWGSSEGYIIRTGENKNLHPDACWQADGSGICVVFNTDQGVRGEIKIPLTAVREDLLREQPLPVVSINRDLWAGFFEFVPAELPGNSVLPHPFNVIKSNIGEELATYTAGDPDGDPDAIERAVVAMKRARPDLPCVAYVPYNFREKQYVRFPPSADVIGLEAYRKAGESIPEYDARLRAAVSRLPRVALIPGCYTSNLHNDPNLEIIPAVCAPIVRDHRNIEMVLVFSGSGRATGYQDHPEVHAAWKSFFSTITTPRHIPTKEPTMNPPKITISEYLPRSGTAPLRVRAVYKAEPDAGPITELLWLVKGTNEPQWKIDAKNDPSDSDHTYKFPLPGEFEIRLVAIGPGGKWETGARRIIKVEASADTPEPSKPTPPAPEPSGPSDGLVPLPESDHAFHREGQEIDKITKSNLSDAAHTAWRRLNENWTHAQILAALKNQPVSVHQRNRVNIPYDQWMKHEVPQIIQLIKKLFVRMPTTGEIRHNAWRRFAEKWTFENILRDIAGEPLVVTEPIEPKPIIVRTAGRIRTDGRFFANDAGTFRPVFASALTALAKPEQQTKEFLSWGQKIGFNGIRVFAGSLPWANQTPEQARDRLGWLLNECYQMGLYVEVTALTDTKEGRYDKRHHTLVIAELCAQFDNAILELANEAWHPTQDDEVHDFNYLRRLYDLVPRHVICALGAPDYDEPQNPDVWPEPIGDYLTLHLDRGRDKWNQVRRVRELEAASAQTRRPVLNNEPTGADELDGSQTGRQRINDPAWFFALQLLNRIFEVGGVFHSQAGLNTELPGPVQEECAKAFVRASRLIPVEDRLTFKNTGWADSPIRSADFNQVIRAYSGITGNRGWTVFVGLSGDPRIEFQNGWQEVGVTAEVPGVKVIEIAR